MAITSIQSIRTCNCNTSL